MNNNCLKNNNVIPTFFFKLNITTPTGYNLSIVIQDTKPTMKSKGVMSLYEKCHGYDLTFSGL